MKYTCCICHQVMGMDVPDWYQVQIRKRGIEPPETVRAHGPCLRAEISVLDIEIPGPGNSNQ